MKDDIVRVRIDGDKTLKEIQDMIDLKEAGGFMFMNNTISDVGPFNVVTFKDLGLGPRPERLSLKPGPSTSGFGVHPPWTGLFLTSEGRLPVTALR